MFFGKSPQQLNDIERALLVQEVQRLKKEQNTRDDAADKTIAFLDRAVTACAKGAMAATEAFKEGWEESKSVEDESEDTSPVMSEYDSRIYTDPYGSAVAYSEFNPYLHNIEVEE